ncbi:hypothetical protein SDC9_112105 [bioreactor metagenome]|uniref:Uncharacterized protein n=1 Tax=bioreactor metagenome TaxID=1076179 RepID=A0A645BIW3_9ZZZZ
MAGHRNVRVARVIFFSKGLLRGPVCRIGHRVDPERTELGTHRNVSIPARIAMVVHIKVQHDIPAPRHLNGGSILHLLGIQIPVGRHHHRPRVIGPGAFGQIKQGAQRAALGRKGDLFYLY